MAIAGNNAGSVVDFLASRGLRAQTGEKFPLYETRKKLFEQAGLNSNLGDFRGAPEQNTALLNVLRAKEANAGVSINPDNIFTVLGLKQPVAPSNTGSNTNPQPTDINASLAELARKAANPAIPENLQEMALKDVQSRATYPLQLEQAQATKEQLAVQAQAKKEKLISDLASRGLIFSGKKETGLKSIEADQLARELGVDRKFALLLAQGLESSTQKIVKEAQKGSTDAAQALSALGYVLTPDGNLVQKPSEQRAEERFALSEASAARAVRSAEMSERRLQLAEESAARAATAPKGGVIGLADIAKYGLPKSLIGQSEVQVVNQLDSPTPAPWFVEQWKKINGMVATPQKLKDDWADFKATVDRKFEDSSSLF